MFDDFDTQIQAEEIIPEEYEDWLRFCAGAYEASEEETKDWINSPLCETLFSTEFNLDKKEYNEWAAWNNMCNSDITP